MDYLTAFGLEADQAGRMADVLSYAQANSNTTTEMLGEAFKNCAVNAHNAGMTLEETTAILSKFADAGLKGSEGGTALNAIIRDMTQKMKNGAIQIGNTKVQVQDANGNFRSMTDIIADVSKATDGMGDAQKTAALMTTFTADSIKGMGILCNTGADSIEEFTKKLENSNGTAEKMSNMMNQNLSGALKTLSSAWEALQLSLGDSTGPLSLLVGLLTKLLLAIKNLPAPVKQVIVTLALLAATIGPTLLIIGKMIEAWVKMKETIGILRSGFGLLRGVLSGLPSVFGIIQGVVSTVGGALSSLWAVLMANPIILVIGIIAALVAAFIYAWNNIDGFKEWWINLWETIKLKAQHAWYELQNFFTQTIPQVISNIGTWFSQLPETIWYWLCFAVAYAVLWVGQMAQKGTQAAQTFKNNIINGISSLPSRMVSIGSNIIHGIISGITSAAGSLFSTMRNIASNALNAAKSALGIHSPSRVFRDAVGKMIPQGVTLGIEANAGQTIKAIKDYASDLVTAIDTNKFLGQVNMSTAGININSENNTDSSLIYAIKSMVQAIQDSKQEFDYKEMGKQYRKALQDTNTPIIMDKVVVGQKVAKSVQDTNDYLQNQQDRFRGDKDYV